jgi:hypothetical protein
MKEESLTENKIFTVTWNHDSHGLFEYESGNISISSFKPEFGFFYRDIKNKVSFSQTLEKDTEKKKYLVTSENKEDKYILYKRFFTDLPINNDTLKSLQEQIWYVLKQHCINQKKFS